MGEVGPDLLVRKDKLDIRQLQMHILRWLIIK